MEWKWLAVNIVKVKCLEERRWTPGEWLTWNTFFASWNTWLFFCRKRGDPATDDWGDKVDSPIVWETEVCAGDQNSDPSDSDVAVPTVAPVARPRLRRARPPLDANGRFPSKRVKRGLHPSPLPGPPPLSALEQRFRELLM